MVECRPDVSIGITDNLKVIKLSEEDMAALNSIAANGKQQRVNTPLFGWDLVRACFLSSRTLDI